MGSDVIFFELPGAPPPGQTPRAFALGAAAGAPAGADGADDRV